MDGKKGRKQMSQMSDKAAKPYPSDLSSPSELPDERPEEHSMPWQIDEAGNGHFYIYDAGGTRIAHVYCWDEKEFNEFEEKIKKLVGDNVV
jgi:hypothetical protein